MTLTKEQLDFLARLARAPEGKFLVGLYEAELRELDVKLRAATGETIYQTQGRAQQLEEMIERIKGAENKAKPQVPTRRPLVSQDFGG